MSQIRALVPLDEPFERPADFDLPRHWQETTASFEREIYVGVARVRATRTGLSRLKDISERCRDDIEAQEPQFDAAGWAVFDVPIEEEKWATREMTRAGAEVEVLSPPSLRAAMTAIAHQLAGFYAADTLK